LLKPPSRFKLHSITADQLAKLGSECPFIGPEPACGISEGNAKKAVRDWTNRDHDSNR
jgi:hypothetical protein